MHKPIGKLNDEPAASSIPSAPARPAVVSSGSMSLFPVYLLPMFTRQTISLSCSKGIGTGKNRQVADVPVRHQSHRRCYGQQASCWLGPDTNLSLRPRWSHNAAGLRWLPLTRRLIFRSVNLLTFNSFVRRGRSVATTPRAFY